MKVSLKYIHFFFKIKGEFMIHLFLCICDADNNLLRAGNTKIQFKMIHIEPLVFIFYIHVLSNVPPVNIQSQLT